MDTINHCLVTRADLQNRLLKKRSSIQLMIPKDGECIAIQM